MKRIFMTGYSGNKGGVETYIDQMIQELTEYEIICSLPIMHIDGKTWHRPHNRHNYFKYRQFWYRFFRENHFDAVYHNTCDIVSIDMLRFAKRAGVPVRIIHSHCTGNQQFILHKKGFFHTITELLNRKVLDRYATHLLACSENAGIWMFDGRPFTVIQNGIDPERFRYRKESREAIREQYGFGNNPVIGIIGRLSEPKNPFFTVRILEALFKIKPSVHAVFVGEGPLHQEIEDQVKRANIQENIMFTGSVDNIADWMSAADILLMPSLFEGMPFVLIEAQASGLPCVVSSAITSDVDLTGLIHFVDLDRPAEEWAQILMNFINQERTDHTEEITSAGYSIQQTAEQIRNILGNGGPLRN